jgi:hypothetical protein
MPDRADTLSTICHALDSHGRAEAASMLVRDYPMLAVATTKRAYSKAQSMRVFARDGFIDRYSGRKLVFPGVLRLLSMIMPEDFPFHPNWKVSETHPAYWEVFPTIDHLTPIARGGADDESNQVCTSMLLNNAKSNWSVEELGWSVRPPGRMADWDGLLSWFEQQVERNVGVLKNAYIKQWHAAAKQWRQSAFR